MKTLLLCITVGFIFFSLKGYSQLKVYEDNRVKIFGDRPTDDANHDLSMQIYGYYSSFLANGRMGFGEYEYNGTVLYSPRVFAGGLGINIDSDKLELCGSNGLYLTSRQGYEYGNIIGKLDLGFLIDPSVFQFQTDVYAKGVIINSDERFKGNIKSLQGTLSKLSMVRGVTYNLKSSKADNSGSNAGASTEKEQNDLALLASTKTKMENLNRTRLGFVAEEIKEVLPNIVEEDSQGYLHVDYIGLIPVLVESIKEQQAQIAALKTFLQSK